MDAELNEYFSILLSTNDASACQIQDDNITVTIVDDGKKIIHFDIHHHCCTRDS